MRSSPAYEDIQKELEDLRKEKLALSKAIKKAKEKAWKAICDPVNSKPWGNPNKIVMGRMVTRQPIPGLDMKKE